MVEVCAGVPLLGSGAFGTVCVGRLSVGDGRTKKVALKVPRHGKLAKEQFAHEAEAAKGMRHENLVAVFGLAALADGQVCIVMELIDGEELHEMIAAGGRLPASQTLWYSQQLAAGLAYMHGRGLVHGDVKPENVMVTPTHRCVLTDFGATVRRGRPLRFGGTPQSVAPEARAAAADATVLAEPALDIWALGTLMFECVTSTRIFPTGVPEDSGAASQQRLLALAKARKITACYTDTCYAPALDMIDWCTAWQPDERPSAQHVHDTLASLAKTVAMNHA